MGVVTGMLTLCFAPCVLCGAWCDPQALSEPAADLIRLFLRQGKPIMVYEVG